MTKKIALINSDITNTIKKYFENKDVEIIEVSEPNINADLIVFNNYSEKLPKNAINIHPSLLPAFEGENAIQEAFLSGVKVSGITIHNDEKIIAQYPVLIGIETHIDEFINDMHEVKKRLAPPVIEAIIEDRVFDFQDLFKNPCARHSGGCSNCGGCH